MELLHLFIFGSLMLIFAYLAFNHADAVSAIFTGAQSFVVSDTQALQGR